MNICNKCKTVHYCNVACKKKHKSKHKKKCDRRVAELHEEALFSEPPRCVKSAQYACYPYELMQVTLNSNHAVENLSVKAVSMQ